jgi:hypothetical protein
MPFGMEKLQFQIVPKKQPAAGLMPFSGKTGLYS